MFLSYNRFTLPNFNVSKLLPCCFGNHPTLTGLRPHAAAPPLAVVTLASAGRSGSPDTIVANDTVVQGAFKHTDSQSIPTRVVALALFTADCIDCSLPPAVQREALQSTRIIGGGILVQVKVKDDKFSFHFHSTGFSAAPHLETETKILNDIEDALTKFDVLIGYGLHGRLLPLLAAKSPTGERLSIDGLVTLPGHRLCDLMQNRKEGQPLPFEIAAGRAGIPVMPADPARDLGQFMSFGDEQSITIVNHITATYRLWLDRQIELSGDVRARENALDQLFSWLDEVGKRHTTPTRFR